jgi:hypothetical protein
MPSVPFLAVGFGRWGEYFGYLPIRHRPLAVQPISTTHLQFDKRVSEP